MHQHASCTVPGDGVLVIPEESSEKYFHSIITFRLYVQDDLSLQLPSSIQGV